MKVAFLLASSIYSVIVQPESDLDGNPADRFCREVANMHFMINKSARNTPDLESVI